MSVQRIASRYAKSLIELAVDQDKLERVLEDVETFKALSENRDFHLFIKSPLIKGEKKIQVLHLLLKDRYDKLTIAFIDILVRKGRETYMPEIAKEFLDQYKKIKHISTVKLTTATKLSEETMSQLHKKLQKSLLTEDHVEITTKVDPELVGGFIVEFDDFVYDASLSHKIDELRKEFSENLYVSQILAR